MTANGTRKKPTVLDRVGDVVGVGALDRVEDERRREHPADRADPAARGRSRRPRRRARGDPDDEARGDHRVERHQQVRVLAAEVDRDPQRHRRDSGVANASGQRRKSQTRTPTRSRRRGPAASGAAARSRRSATRRCPSCRRGRAPAPRSARSRTRSGRARPAGDDRCGGRPQATRMPAISSGSALISCPPRRLSRFAEKRVAGVLPRFGHVGRIRSEDDPARPDHVAVLLGELDARAGSARRRRTPVVVATVPFVGDPLAVGERHRVVERSDDVLSSVADRDPGRRIRGRGRRSRAGPRSGRRSPAARRRALVGIRRADLEHQVRGPRAHDGDREDATEGEQCDEQRRARGDAARAAAQALGPIIARDHNHVGFTGEQLRLLIERLDAPRVEAEIAGDLLRRLALAVRVQDDRLLAVGTRARDRAEVVAVRTDVGADLLARPVTEVPLRTTTLTSLRSIFATLARARRRRRRRRETTRRGRSQPRPGAGRESRPPRAPAAGSRGRGIGASADAAPAQRARSSPARARAARW